MTIAEFSSRTGIPKGTLSCWRHIERRLALEKPKSPDSLVPVEVVEDTRVDEAGDVARSGEPSVVVELAAGHRVSLPTTLGPEALGKLIAKVLPC
jgi:hypothetical protein